MLKRLYKDILNKRRDPRLKALGAEGEAFALDLVKKAGMSLLVRNFRIPRGEVDLIAQDGDTVVFIEVKTRGSRKYGEPYEAVGAVKQRKIICAAEAFLKQFQPVPPCRFDVISIMAEGSRFSAEWIRDAFEA